MSLQVEQQEVRAGMARITVSGKMMLGAESERVQHAVDDLLARGYRTIVIDLSGLKQIDSTGIGRFIASYNNIRTVEGASLRLAGADGAVRSAFRVTKLDTVFQFYDTIDQALT
ncbi:MAG: STAS domain-containing protein [Candidatus Solibacter usitatus]|nr:STAS domain-containing protein [Candidatus Solibacter usitatus]